MGERWVWCVDRGMGDGVDGLDGVDGRGVEGGREMGVLRGRWRRKGGEVRGR